MAYLHQILSLGLRKLYQRGVEKVVRARRDGEQYGNMPSKYRIAETHVNSKRLWQHTQGLQKSAQFRILELREAVTCLHPEPKSYLQL